MKVRARKHPADLAVELVDTALTFAARRPLFTRDEAVELLHGVLVKLDDPEIESALAPIVDGAETTYAAIRLVERASIVDSLLDMRLALDVRSA